MANLSPGRLQGLTVAVTGATGNLGTALLRRLTAPQSGVAEVRGLARRQPPDVAPYDRVRWHLTDLGESASERVLPEFLGGADAVVHLAWALQPGRHPEQLHRVNVEGTRRVVRAAVAAGVEHVVHMSSLAAYAPGAGDRQVSEDFPTTGIPTSQYSRDKAEAELVVREILGRYPGTTSTIVRPTLVLQPEASSEIGRYFFGPLLHGVVRLVPGPVAHLLPLPLPDLTVAFVHSDDVAEAVARILDRRAPGPFNVAADPVMDADAIARTLGMVRVPVPAGLLRAALQAAYTARLVPTEPGWLDVALQAPALDWTRARTLLDWTPSRRGDEALAEFVAALARGEGARGPLLQPAGGPERAPAGDAGRAAVPSPG